MTGPSRAIPTLLADLAAGERLEPPIAATFPLDNVHLAFELVELRHTTERPSCSHDHRRHDHRNHDHHALVLQPR